MNLKTFRQKLLAYHRRFYLPYARRYHELTCADARTLSPCRGICDRVKCQCALNR